MKNKTFKKLLTHATSLLACALLIGNTIPVPTPTDEEENPIIIELPSPGDEGENEEPGYSPLDDDEPFSGNNE